MFLRIGMCRSIFFCLYLNIKQFLMKFQSMLETNKFRLGSVAFRWTQDSESEDQNSNSSSTIFLYLGPWANYLISLGFICNSDLTSYEDQSGIICEKDICIFVKWNQPKNTANSQVFITENILSWRK